ncbi:MAG: hypothetical protein HC838_09870 [Spirulinaceae cyanobacterium RM2_2_10]|nr:hypothetical protein [Spirulinaceae cyanobacterium RM2_2_10]
MESHLTSFFRISVACDGNSRQESFSATSASQISIEMNPQEVSQGGTFRTTSVRDFSQVARLRVELPVIAGRPPIIEQWWREVTDSSKVLSKRIVDVTQTDAGGNEVRTWRLKGAWPCKIGLSSLSGEGPTTGLTEYYEFVYEAVEQILGSPHSDSNLPSTVREQRNPQTSDPFAKSLTSESARKLYAEIELLDVSTKYGEAVFYSGVPKNMAMKEARELGKKTIEMTPGGDILDRMNLFEKGSPVSRRDAIKIWRKASAKYASQASGPTRVIEKVRTYRDMRRGTFRSVELPLLKKNPNITQIQHTLVPEGP